MVSLNRFHRRVDWVKRNRAFIAAPLLGTIIFLACIIFIINLNKIESANVVLAEGDAYHNRMVSLLEMYRSDVASMFRQQMTFVIENYLASQCWLNLFDINNGIGAVSDNSEYENDKIQRLPPFNGYTGLPATKAEDYTIQELRYHKCKYINRLINSVGRSVNGCKARCLPESQGGPCGTLCINQAACMELESGCAACQDCLNKLYGLSKILNDLSRNTTFEGIDFNVSNRGEFQFVFDNDLTIGNNRAEQFTSTLMSGSLFDCGAFAKDGTLQCCSVSGDMTSEHRNDYLYDYANTCGQRSGHLITDNLILLTGKKVSGCEDGSFFMKISMQNSIVFPVMPRFSADDAVGNQLRTGALGDSDFDIPISYPLYRYLNYSFQLYEKLAYGENSDASAHDGDREGIAQGFCAASNAAGNNILQANCEKEDSKYKDAGYRADCGDSNNPCETEVAKDFVKNTFKKALDAFYNLNGWGHSAKVLAYFCSASDTGVAGTTGACSDSPESWKWYCGGSTNGAVSNPEYPDNQDLCNSSVDTVEKLQGGQNNMFQPDTNNTCTDDSLLPGQKAECSFFTNVQFAVRFNDLSEEHRVDPAVQNRFCAFLKITHYPGSPPSNTVT